ncbi:MAG: molybdenum cofactor guanylyltransferase MobA [Thermoplasmata archaeon]|nr:molybdenum cofactor guanylyltransferase MobA [Euryarchaeota archaeon]RLF66681.1 MAG: molybdenum cofactor guanylyltransferase MobA [Thermoplasmata archaeon]
MICAVLAGGNSRTFGRDKLMYNVFGKPLIMYCIERLRRAKNIDKIVIVTKKERKETFESLGFEVIVDELLVGPIGGIYTALLEIGEAFVIAGDMPLVVPELVDLIVGLFKSVHCDVCVPMWPNGFLEPLHAAYSSDILKRLRESIRHRKYSIQNVIRQSRAYFIKIEKIPQKWHESFFNVNTKEDLKELMIKLQHRAGDSI